jgi:hypothetical protein
MEPSKAQLTSGRMQMASDGGGGTPSEAKKCKAGKRGIRFPNWEDAGSLQRTMRPEVGREAGRDGARGGWDTSHSGLSECKFGA